MKAIQYSECGGPEVLKLVEDAPKPTLKPGEVLVKVHVAGVNPADTYLRTGGNGYPTPSFPCVPGKDGAGQVEELGEGVSGLEVGQRVFFTQSRSGATAEFSAVGAEYVAPLPESLSYEQGASVGVPSGTAWRALYQRAQAKAGESLLVHGASGGVGLSAVQLGSAMGLKVIGTASTAEGRELVKQHGADIVLDHSDPEHFKAVVEATGGKGVDTILEMLANINLGRDLPTLAQGGKVVIIGNRGTAEINGRDLMTRNASVMGMLGTRSPKEVTEFMAGLASSLSIGTLKPIVDKSYPMDQTAAAHHDVINGGGGTKGNLVVSVV